jgi:hypothetical protein
MTEDFVLINSSGVIHLVLDNNSYVIPTSHKNYRKIMSLLNRKTRFDIVLKNSMNRKYSLKISNPNELLNLLK